MKDKFTKEIYSNITALLHLELITITYYEENIAGKLQTLKWNESLIVESGIIEKLKKKILRIFINLFDDQEND